MYKLSQLSPMDADPGQIKIALRTHEFIGIPKGAARIDLSYENAQRNIMIADTYLVEISQTDAVPPELEDGMAAHERVTILQLTEKDAQRMRYVQSLVKEDEAAGAKGKGSLGIGLHGVCLHTNATPPDDLEVDIFLQTSDDAGFFVFNENFAVNENTPGWNSDMRQWPRCH